MMASRKSRVSPRSVSAFASLPLSKQVSIRLAGLRATSRTTRSISPTSAGFGSVIPLSKDQHVNLDIKGSQATVIPAANAFRKPSCWDWSIVPLSDAWTISRHPVHGGATRLTCAGLDHWSSQWKWHIAGQMGLWYLNHQGSQWQCSITPHVGIHIWPITCVNSVIWGKLHAPP